MFDPRSAFHSRGYRPPTLRSTDLGTPSTPELGPPFCAKMNRSNYKRSSEGSATHPYLAHPNIWGC